MGFGSKCSILNIQVTYIEKSKLNIADMRLIPLDRVTYILPTNPDALWDMSKWWEQLKYCIGNAPLQILKLFITISNYMQILLIQEVILMICEVSIISSIYVMQSGKTHHMVKISHFEFLVSFERF